MNGKGSTASQATGSRRFDWLDALRGVALIAMTTFHFSWDLEFFGYAPAGLTSQPLFKWYARGIAFSFLVIAGFSFALAHRNGINSRTFIKRLAQIGGAALLISIVTWYTTPDRFVFFGILHQIAAAALISHCSSGRMRPGRWRRRSSSPFCRMCSATNCSISHGSGGRDLVRSNPQPMTSCRCSRGRPIFCLALHSASCAISRQAAVVSANVGTG